MLAASSLSKPNPKLILEGEGYIWEKSRVEDSTTSLYFHGVGPCIVIIIAGYNAAKEVAMAAGLHLDSPALALPTLTSLIQVFQNAVAIKQLESFKITLLGGDDYSHLPWYLRLCFGDGSSEAIYAPIENFLQTKGISFINNRKRDPFKTVAINFTMQTDHLVQAPSTEIGIDPIELIKVMPKSRLVEYQQRMMLNPRTDTCPYRIYDKNERALIAIVGETDERPPSSAVFADYALFPCCRRPRRTPSSRIIAGAGK